MGTWFLLKLEKERCVASQSFIKLQRNPSDDVSLNGAAASKKKKKVQSNKSVLTSYYLLCDDYLLHSEHLETVLSAFVHIPDVFCRGKKNVCIKVFISKTTCQHVILYSYYLLQLLYVTTWLLNEMKVLHHINYTYCV